MRGPLNDSFYSYVRLSMKLLLQVYLAVIWIVLISSCASRGYNIPVTTCSSFSFTAVNDAEATAARKLMYAAAIEFNLRFDDTSFGLSAPRAEILWSSDRGDRLVLAGLRNNLTKQTSFSILYLIGGVDGYRYPAAVCEKSPDQFNQLHHLFSEKWPLQDVQVSSGVANHSFKRTATPTLNSSISSTGQE